MVYGIIGMINFAHGEIYMIRAYVGLITLTAIGDQQRRRCLSSSPPCWWSPIFVTGVYGYSVERVAYRPVRAARLVALISAIGMSIFLQNWVAPGQGARHTCPALVSGAVQFHMGSSFDVTVPYSRIDHRGDRGADGGAHAVHQSIRAWGAPRAARRIM